MGKYTCAIPGCKAITTTTIRSKYCSKHLQVQAFNPQPEQLSACCNAPVVWCEGNAWDVPLSAMRAGSTYFYGCTKCREACDLSSTDSPEPSTPDPTYNLDEIHQCKGCGLSKHVDSRGYCGRCNDKAPIQNEHPLWEPDELLDIFMSDYFSEYSLVSQEVARLRLLAWKQSAVDAAVAASLTDLRTKLSSDLLGHDWERFNEAIEEQLKNKETI